MSPASDRSNSDRTERTEEQPRERPEAFDDSGHRSAGGRRVLALVRPVTATLLFGSLVAVAGHASRQGLSTLSALGIEAGTLSWLYAIAVLFLAVVFVPVVASAPGRARKLLSRLRERPVIAISGGYVTVLVVVGSLYPLVAPETVIRPVLSFQPPVWGETDTIFLAGCEGRVVDGMCQGTMEFPLGTNPKGEDLLTTSLLALATTLRVAVTASAIAATVGIAVGITAGYTRGKFDELLMRYVDIQRSLPAFFVYILVLIVVGRSYSLLVLVFGLLSWGGIARTVRGEVLQRRKEPYVKSAEISGAGKLRVVRRHILPNVSNTVVTGAVVLFAKFVLYEASLGFLALTETSIPSLGNEISFATGREGIDPDAEEGNMLGDWYNHPHVVAVPAGILCSLLLAVSILGDGLRDLLDPRE